MAADAALLRELTENPEALPVIRVYTWDRPCVTMGRSQDESTVRAAYSALPLVRRPTGGRAVLHGDDLTLSIAARLSDLPPGSGTGVFATYRLLAAPLVEAFCAFGIAAEWGKSRQDHPAQGVDCFSCAARCDLIDGCTGQKLVGCAQRRAGNALLQQMSIPKAFVAETEGFIAIFRDYAARDLGITAWSSGQTAESRRELSTEHIQTEDDLEH